MANLKDIIGQAKVKNHLQTAISSGKTSHAYIFAGETGSGRRMMADAFAKTLLCQNRTNGDACDICKSCLQMESGSHPDVRYIHHDKSSISVDDIREQINQDIDVKPYSSEYKIYIIPEAAKMTEQAQNALLKTIEEPPAYAVILLLTDNLQALLPTIQSRCVTLQMNPLSQKEIAGYLMKNLSMEEQQAYIAAGFCQGNMGKAIRFATSKEFGEMKDEVLRLLKKVTELSVSEIMDTIKGFSQRKGMIQDYLDFILLWYRDVLMWKVTKDANLLLYKDEFTSISKAASHYSYEDIEKILKAIDKAKLRLDANVNFDVTIELLVLTMKD